MSRNIGTIDRTIRIVAGLGLISLSLTGLHTPWGWIGVIPLVTAFVSWCPLYTLLGITTCPAGKPRG